MIQFTHAEQKTVVGQRQLFFRYKAAQKHASDTVHLRTALPTSTRVSRARWHTRTQRSTRIQRPNAVNHRLCTVHNGTRSGEGQPTTLNSWAQHSSIHARAKQTCGAIIPTSSTSSEMRTPHAHSFHSTLWPYPFFGVFAAE